MELPSEAKPAFCGAVIGALALATYGFTMGGWITGSHADVLASERTTKAVVAAMAPICADNKVGSAQLVELQKVMTIERGGFVSKGGWASIPGSAAVDPEMARSYAELILDQKS